MKLILLSGGSGKRLWPLSNDSRSKQFIKVLENEDGQSESMVQRVWKQLRMNELASSSLIATSAAQVEMIQSQLGIDVPVITEPERRDTFPAIALSTVYLFSEQQCGLDEVIVILPVDPFVEDHFFSKVKELETILDDSNADLALMGVTPTYPSEKYGYIVPEKNITNSKIVKVSSFTEKPKADIAKKLIEDKALWNCGVFAFRLSYIIELLIKKGLPTNYADLLKEYKRLPKTSFDYEVVEKATEIVALSYDGYWKDLGTWNTLTEEMSSSMIGKGIISNDVENSHIINELDIPISLIGINNAVIAASPDGILISDKESSPKVKEYVSDFEGRPMYEERRWGWYRVLEYTKYAESNEVLTKRIGIKTAKNLSYQYHLKRNEVWTIVKGEGILLINGELRQVEAGDVIQIPLETKHALRATSDMEIIEVQTGSELIEEDIIRLAVDWDQILSYVHVNLLK